MTDPSPNPNLPGRWSARLTALYQVGLGGLVLLLGTRLAWRPLAGWLDFWAHAAVGRWTAETGAVPRQALFLWTSSEPWVYHHWLSQLIFYGLTRVGPEYLPSVTLGFTAVMALLPFALVWVVWRRSGRLTSLAAVPTVLAIDALATRFQTRPELFTEVCLSVLMMYLVLRSRAPSPDNPARARRRTILAAVGIVALFAVWANLHGAVVLGVLVLAVTAACDLIQYRDRSARRIALLAVLAPLAVCLNPFGVGYWTALASVGSSTFARIQEWQPIWETPLLPTQTYAAIGAIAAVAGAAWALNPHRRWAYLGWLVMLAVMFAAARRNAWPFALVALMVTAANAAAIDPEALWNRLGRWLGRKSGRRAPPPPEVLRWSARLAILVWVVLKCWLASGDLRPWRQFVPTHLDRGVVAFITAHQLGGRVFNDYENSSYLQWRLAGHPKLYIDLLNAYPDQVAQDYLDLIVLSDRGRRLLDEQRIGVVILTTDRGGGPSLVRLANHLDADPGWVRVYAGQDGVIWVRRSGEYESVWRPLEGSVSRTSFAVLARWGGDDDLLKPAD